MKKSHHHGPTQMAVTQKSTRRQKAKAPAAHAPPHKPDLPTIAAAVTALRQLDRPLRTDEAAFYLTEGCGVPTSAGHLANLRVVGGGPTFRLAGRFPIYAIPALDAYAEQRIGPEQTSTSSRRAA
jgi:hypothetical protein